MTSNGTPVTQAPRSDCLFNELTPDQVYATNERWHAHLFEQYRLYVEMADRISTRRALANSYFLSVSSAILAFGCFFAGRLATDNVWLLASAGIVLSCMWEAMLRNYSNLNRAKFEVIHQIEKRLAIRPYEAEWEAMGRGLNRKLYRPITHIERGVPVVFFVLHAIVFAKSFPYWQNLSF